MKQVTVEKEDLLTKIRENREKHRAIFEEAVEGYRKLVTKRLEEQIERIKSGSLERVQISLPRPEDHTSDYDRAITMLEMSVDDEVEIDEYTFAAYVMDDWDWKQQFLASNQHYSKTADSIMKGEIK